MWIGGLQKFSLIDYPGKLSCVLFTRGCNFRCRYCHNPELVLPDKYCPVISEDKVMEFLKTRTDYLDGVVISGGEPTIQQDLVSFLGKLKHLGYLVKLDTNGSHPDVLKQVINLKLVNYIAMDVKAPLRQYRDTIAVPFDIEKIEESINILNNSEIKHEFRTTVVRHLCMYHDICKIVDMIGKNQKYSIQKARIDEHILDKELLQQEQYSEDEFHRLKFMLEEMHL